VGYKQKRCEQCGNLFKVKYPNQKLCVDCSVYQPIGEKIIKCIDCGCDVEVGAKHTKKNRCEACYKKYRKNKKLETQRIRREKVRMKSDQFKS